MVCPRCGTTFEGRFCPNCGTPAAGTPPSPTAASPPPAPAAAPPPAYFRCGRCGTLYSGKFCPACGLPAWSAWIPPPVPRGPSGALVLLNVAWSFSLVAFLVILGIATAGMVAVIPSIASGISTINSGATADSGFDTSPSPWTFSPWFINATGSVPASGGNPGPYAEMQLNGSQGAAVNGYWWQSVRVEGSHPYLAGVFFDYKVIQVSSILSSLTIRVYVDTSAGAPLLGQELWTVTLGQTTGWTTARSVDPSTGQMIDAIDVSTEVRAEGTYYLKIAVIAVNQPGGGPGTPTVVGLDNGALRFWTNAWIDVVVFAPSPILLALTQDPLAFYVWTAGLVAAVVATLVILVRWDGPRLWAAVKMGSERMAAKLRTRSAFVALMQTYLAVLFLNVVIALLSEPPEPTFFSEIPQWYLYWILLNASVYEEVVFRVLLIGLPMMGGSLVLRVVATAKGRGPAGTGAGRYLAGSLRYLYGGGVGRNTSLATLIPGLALLALSSAIFGFAHVPGYGDWKALPAAVAGLAMGYLFLRHGLPAAIAFHFATDMFVATWYLVGPDSPVGIAMNLGFLFLGLIPGAGFFAYYLLYTFRFAQDVARRARPSRPGPASATPHLVYPPASPPPPGMPYGQPSWPPVPMPAPQAQVPSGYVPATRPPAYGTSPVEYRCPRCAWVEASYEAGHFRCLRCGYVS